jgi:hypothetical protein
MLNRRSFVVGASAAALIAMRPELSEAFRDDASAQSGGETSSSNSKTVVNFGGGDFSLFNMAYLNLAKYFQFLSPQSGWPGLLSGASGYPNGNFTSTAGSLVYFDPSYYGRYVLSWDGTGALSGISGNPTIIYSGGAAAAGVRPASKGETAGNNYFSGTDVNVEFAFGCLISAVSVSLASDNGGGGLVKFTTANSGRSGNFFDGMRFKLNHISGLPAGPNTDGSWTIYKIDNNNFSLKGSSAQAGSVMVIGHGGPGVQTEAVYSVTADTAKLYGIYANFANLIWCKKGDLAAIQDGRLATQEIVDALGGTKAAYLRFMDICAIQNIQGASYANRTKPSSFTWGGIHSPLAYWGGVMTNIEDTFTCPLNPPGSPRNGEYIDGEVVIAQVGTSGRNTTQNPRMGISGRLGTAPIYTATCNQLNLTLSGSVPPTGTTISLVFTGGGLLSPFTYNYLTSTTVKGPAGVPDTSLLYIIYNIRKDLQSNSRGNAGPLVAAGIYCLNPNFPDGSGHAGFFYNPNVTSSGVAKLGAGFSITGSDTASAMTYTFGMVPTGYLGDNYICTFTYCALLSGWVCTPGGSNGGAVAGGVRGGPPLEWYSELCARCDSGMWYNIGVLDTASTIYDTVFYIAQATYNGQTAVKSLALEFGNETWNSGLALRQPCQTLSACLGISVSGGGGDYSFHGLRTIQMAQHAVAAWAAAGRLRSQLKIVNAYQFVNMNAAGTSDTSIFRFNGAALNASVSGANVTLRAFGGLGATAISTNHSVAPNRPVDWCDWISPATYWQGAQFNTAGQFWNGGHLREGVPLNAYDASLLAAYNHAHGTSAQKQGALDFLYNPPTNSGDLYDGLLNGSFYEGGGQTIAAWTLKSRIPQLAGYYGVGTVAASYDRSRASLGTGGGAQQKLGVACYEGGWEMGPVSGADANSIAKSLIDLGYANGHSSSLVGAATGGPTGQDDTATLAAQNLQNLLFVWKNDTRAQALVAQQFKEFKEAVNVISERDFYAAWYGLQGTGNIWSLYPDVITQSLPFRAYDAIAAFR